MSQSQNHEITLAEVRVTDYWAVNGAPYSDTAERIGYGGADNRNFIEAAHRLGTLLLEKQEDYRFTRHTDIPPLPNFGQLGFATAGHALWYAVDNRVKDLTNGDAFFGEVMTPGAFERTEVPTPILAVVVGSAAKENPEEFPGFALAISKIESPSAQIPVYSKLRNY